eukprot:CAMPEP_0204902548 /NCGR_PEP_ID=MMETSP1397-20131031/3736_1 /ASSEMBLY_ACC=CAM_ASM_000891 /TAXON_ID=49980 /ORGANISM="Climacostomum Climacostomum virens, Strain Stock W-24" /LENGTH=223 /DNA_ID=CAMNT_0052071071 /DNA_START=1582 /DNA_END=2253 /DNA_ORIENTATION=+
MDKFILFSNKTEGRDKLCKVFQYGSRFLKAALSDPDIIQRLNGLFGATRDARKIFRLFKTLHEIEAIMKALATCHTFNIDTALTVLSRISFGIYWILDNLSILGSIKLFTYDTKPIAKHGMTAWLAAILFSAAGTLKKLIESYNEEDSLRKRKPDMETREALKKLGNERKNNFLNLLKNLGDFFPAANGSQLPLELIGRNIDERLCGLGGLLSGAIACYQAWP